MSSKTSYVLCIVHCGLLTPSFLMLLHKQRFIEVGLSLWVGHCSYEIMQVSSDTVSSINWKEHLKTLYRKASTVTSVRRVLTLSANHRGYGWVDHLRSHYCVMKSFVRMLQFVFTAKFDLPYTSWVISGLLIHRIYLVLSRIVKKKTYFGIDYTVYWLGQN